jgi:hypothetical protein
MQKKVCDRYRTTKNIKTCAITVEHDGAPIITRTFDLSPRGLAWVKGFIERGIAKLDAPAEGGTDDQ